jgi:hypothetical protein
VVEIIYSSHSTGSKALTAAAALPGLSKRAYKSFVSSFCQLAAIDPHIMLEAKKSDTSIQLKRDQYWNGFCT